MNYIETLDYIKSFSVLGSVLGLERLIELLDKMGNPHKELKFVHIAGTNGKGSTSAMLSNILTQANYKTGLYISPHVLGFRECMQIDGRMVSEKELCLCAEFVKQFVEEMKAKTQTPTQFEIETAIAFEWYRRQKCDIVCLEVGLGGRHDATNVIDCPLVHVITAIDFDHTAILGEDISKIAFEKAGIIKGTQTVIYPLQHEKAKTVILECCEKQNSVPIIPDLSKLSVLDKSWKATRFSYDGVHFEKKLPALFQVYNAVTAYHVALELRKHHYEISEKNIVDGINGTFFPARTEVLASDPLVILDGAHNLSGIKALENTIACFKDKKINFILGLLADKDFEKMLSVMIPYASNVITLTPNNPRALSATELEQVAKKYCRNTYSFSKYDEAIDCALSKTAENDVLIIFGSLYLASDIRQLLIEKTRQHYKVIE